jgi:hypothetical protein
MKNGFENTVAYKGMSKLTLNGYIQNTDFVKNELIPILGVTPKLQDGIHMKRLSYDVKT